MLRIGFDIGGTNIAAGAVDESNRIVAGKSQPFPRGAPYPEVVNLLKCLTDELLHEAGGMAGSGELASIGMGVPGDIHGPSGMVNNAHNLGFHNVPMRPAMEALFPGIPVFLANDANAATLAELHLGALRGCRTGLLLTLGTGVGGGLVLCGEVFEGGLGHGVEMGHMCIQKDGPLCTCGNKGCVEALCSASWLAAEGRKVFAEAPASLICSLAQGKEEKVDGKTVIEAAKAGDPAAVNIFRRYVDQLSTALSSYCVLLDPERIVIGGGVSLAGEYLLEPLRQQVKEKSFFHHPYEIVAAELGSDAGILGAALLRR